jgi:prepilin-type N-terminal cleavage/methylation domain-containing protein
MNKSFTLLELIIVVIILAILVSISLPLFSKTKEKAIDKEAQASVKLIMAAEKIYRMEVGGYYGTTLGNQDINNNLRLSLPYKANRNWNYTTTAGGASDACAQGQRYSGPDTRTWRIRSNEEEPVEGGSCP